MEDFWETVEGKMAARLERAEEEECRSGNSVMSMKWTPAWSIGMLVVANRVGVTVDEDVHCAIPISRPRSLPLSLLVRVRW